MVYAKSGFIYFLGETVNRLAFLNPLKRTVHPQCKFYQLLMPISFRPHFILRDIKQIVKADLFPTLSYDNKYDNNLYDLYNLFTLQ